MTYYPIAVLISGGGSTLRNLLERSADGRLQAQVCGVIASRDCAGLAHAIEFGVPTAVVPRAAPGAQFEPAEFSARITTQLMQWQPSLVVLGGFLSPYLPAPQFIDRVINIHPALLPHFAGKGMYGERVHAAVLASQTQVSGCTVHLVDEHYDHGAVLAQRAVPVLPQDSPASLGRRVAAAEQELYPEVINWFASGRLEVAAGQIVKLAGRRVIPAAAPPASAPD